MTEQEQKIVDDMNEQEWKRIYAEYIMSHSNAEQWQADESADAAWEMAEDDESAEECAIEELSYWE